MYTALLTVLSLLIMLLAVYDILYTTLSARGAGPVASFISAALWRLFSGLHRLFGNRSILSVTGTTIVAATVVSWVLLLWVGNALLFITYPDAVIKSETNMPADNLERIYYTGYVLSTMGNGDFSAGTDFWKIYSSVVSFSGLIFITIAITYMVPVLEAVTTRRALSIRIASIGSDPQAMLLNNWNGKDFKMLGDQLNGLEQPLAIQGQMHLAYPVLYYFQHTDKEVSLLLNLVALDEALSILLLYIPEDKRPEDRHLIPARKVISSFIYTIVQTYVKGTNEEAPPLKTEELRKENILLLTPSEDQLQKIMYRRRCLKAVIEKSGWNWDTLDQPVSENKLDVL